MSNIANQVVAVVATLLGFIAHDFLAEAKAVGNTTPVLVASAATVDPIVTRSVALGDLSLHTQCSSATAEAMPAAATRTPAQMTTISGARLLVSFEPRPNPGPAPTENSAAAYLR